MRTSLLLLTYLKRELLVVKNHPQVKEKRGTHLLDSSRALAGLLARWIMPESPPARFVITILLGIGGTLVGGFVFSILGGTGAIGFNVWSILVTTFGAIILLFRYGLMTRRTV